MLGMGLSGGLLLLFLIPILLLLPLLLVEVLLKVAVARVPWGFAEENFFSFFLSFSRSGFVVVAVVVCR